MITDAQTDGWKDRRITGEERCILIKVIVICKDDYDATIKSTVTTKLPHFFSKNKLKYVITKNIATSMLFI